MKSGVLPKGKTWTSTFNCQQSTKLDERVEPSLHAGRPHSSQRPTTSRPTTCLQLARKYFVWNVHPAYTECVLRLHVTTFSAKARLNTTGEVVHCAALCSAVLCFRLIMLAHDDVLCGLEVCGEPCSLRIMPHAGVGVRHSRRNHSAYALAQPPTSIRDNLDIITARSRRYLTSRWSWAQSKARFVGHPGQPPTRCHFSCMLIFVFVH